MRTRAKTKGTAKAALPVPRHQHLEYRPKSKPVSPLLKKSLPHPVTKPGTLPLPKTAGVVDGMTDISGSLRALVEKYSLNQYTIATSDGLVFASGGGESAEKDAARYGGMSGSNLVAETPGITLLRFTHKGSNLIGIIRTNLQIPTEIRRMIEQDTQDILNWWI